MTATGGRRHRRRQGTGEDETVGLAGWMYTDLLLGLAVVFLGSIAFAIRASGGSPTDEQSEGSATPTTEVTSEPTATTSTSSTTTTTTLPPEVCTVLYSPSESSQDGFTIRIPGRQGDEQLAAAFRQAVEDEIVEQNARIESEDLVFPPFNFEDLRISIVIVSGDGSDRFGGNQLARQTMSRLKTLFPEQLDLAVVRAQWTVREGSSVGIELFPTVSDECTKLRAATAGN